MKRTIYISIIYLLISCQQRIEIKSENRLHFDSAKNVIEALSHIDTTNAVIDSYTDSFLIKPFDLYKFKSNKNGSLSGGANFKEYHFKPAYNGIGYRFFMFEPKTVNYIDDGREIKHSKIGYLGTNKKMISFMDNGIEILTFQPYDKYKNMYLNPNEVLIELKAKFNDFDLPEMAFVGLDSTTIIKKLAKQTFYKNNCLVYTKDNIALILHLNNSRVVWIRYILLSKKLDFETENIDLYKLD